MGVGVALQAAGLVVGLAGARQAKAASEMEARAYEEQAQMASIQARQQEEERRTQLRKQLASLGTSMSAQGVALSPNQGSVGAIKKAEIDIAKKDISSIKLMGMSNRRKYEISAAGSRASGRATMTTALGKAAGQAYSINKGVG
jgi:hypothetical protein